VLDAVKCWRSGAHRLTEKQIEKLKAVKPKRVMKQSSSVEGTSLEEKLSRKRKAA